tara:strand:- start:658 stop:2148 length:1491 start_codon:yes stop_codon:yes gene_type:complete
MPVDSRHPQYDKNVNKWLLVRDCDEGAYAVKSRSKGTDSAIGAMKGTAYLPPPNASDGSTDNKLRYQAYVDRANFVNFTAHTKEGMLGMVFRKLSTIEVDSSIDYMLKNANGDGLSLDQMIKDSASDALMVGRYGLLVDYPSAPEGLTDYEVSSLYLRANILPYPAESIINWRTVNVGGLKKLSLVVLQEPTLKPSEDNFDYEECMYHRVLRLENGVYVQNLYDEDGELVIYEDGNSDIYPRKFDGSFWDEIPFSFVGSVNNDETVDKAPLYDIAEINISHYRNSADYEESSFLVGQPTPTFSGLTQSWVDQNMSNGISFGSRSAILLPEGGGAELLQASENQMPLKGMQMKEMQMVKIGTRIIEDGGGEETAEAAKIRFAGQNSKLGAIIINVESAFEKCLDWAMMYMGGNAEPSIEINKQFYDATIDPQLLIANIQLMEKGIVAKSDVRYLMRKASLISPERTDEDLDADISQQTPILSAETEEELYTPEPLKG